MTHPPTDTLKTTLFLYGPPGVGKSSTGRALADRLDLPFTDLEHVVAGQAEMTSAEIYQAEGQDGYRARERQALETVLRSGTGVVALSAGVLLDPTVRNLAESLGLVLSMTANEEELALRIQRGGSLHPDLQGDLAQGLKVLLAERSSHYAGFDHVFDSSELGPDEMAQEIQIRLGRFWLRGQDRGYDVHVGAGALGYLGGALRRLDLQAPLMLVTDEAIAPLHGQRVLDSLRQEGLTAEVVVVPSGESAKTLSTVQSIWDAFLSAGLERKSLVLALGGGVIGDLAGFAAATYLRGINWIALPTTLLAMVDASLGGKTGFDLPQGKNLIGAFHSPQMVIADPDVLLTLPEAELRSGMAEVVKHGVIHDAELFEQCQALHGDLSKAAGLIARAMAVKIRVVQIDPLESGLRASLNLGHTVGHGVELASDFEIRHGEAVAIGMVAEARLSETLNIADQGLADQIAACLKSIGLPTEIPSDLDRGRILQAMQHDKKKRAGRVKFALPVRIGQVLTDVEVEDLGAALG
jgi:3-dehydroquinate synthase